MRRATTDDIDYFIEAGRAFCRLSGFSFNPKTYSESVIDVLLGADTIAVVDGDPIRCHCVARLVPSLYDANEIIARIFSTWGQGGLQCFKKVHQLSQDAGAAYLIADQMYDKRIAAFYRRQGMKEGDQTWVLKLR